MNKMMLNPERKPAIMEAFDQFFLARPKIEMIIRKVFEDNNAIVVPAFNGDENRK